MPKPTIRIIEGVNHRRLKKGEIKRKGDVYRCPFYSDKFKPTNEAGLAVNPFDFEYYRPLKPAKRGRVVKPVKAWAPLTTRGTISPSGVFYSSKPVYHRNNDKWIPVLITPIEKGKK